MSPFRLLLRARYPECDAQGIVFNARYGEWVDLATTELFRAIDPAWLQPGGLDYRLRHQETEWLAPARFDDVVELIPLVQAVGHTSFTVSTGLARAGTGEALAQVTTVYVLVDPAGRKRPVPEGVGWRLLAGAPGRVTDQAGVGGGRVLRVVGAGDRSVQAWKNGGGVTHELHREGEGESGFGLRLSIAEVAADGAFSRFPGVDRALTLLDGAGFELVRADGLRVRVDRGAPFVFHGEDDWRCALVAGPTWDFNVMVDRAWGRATVVARGPGMVTGRWVLALQAGRVGDRDVERWDLVELDGPVRAALDTIEVWVG